MSVGPLPVFTITCYLLVWPQAITALSRLAAHSLRVLAEWQLPSIDGADHRPDAHTPLPFAAPLLHQLFEQLRLALPEEGDGEGEGRSWAAACLERRSAEGSCRALAAAAAAEAAAAASSSSSS